VSSRHLLTLFDSIYLAALSAWLGGALVFTFDVAPILFRAAGADWGVKLVRAIFPRYYIGGAISGAVALPAFVAGPLCFQEYRGAMVGVQALLIIFGILLMLYGANSLTPAICAAMDQAESGQARSRQLRRRAAGLDILVFVAGLSLLVAFVMRPAPKTAGIIEMTPQERARYDQALNRVIEDVEARYGLRPPRVLVPGETVGPDPLIDAETVREIESYYAKKQLRDKARAGKPPPAGARLP
jgi:Domain of unknown function (DUF4149)